VFGCVVKAMHSDYLPCKMLRFMHVFIECIGALPRERFYRIR
jgi:hypothetical protein